MKYIIAALLGVVVFTSYTQAAPPDYSMMNTYQAVAVSQTGLAIGAGKKGDRIERIVVTAATAVASNVSIQDGANTAIPLTVATTPVGVYIIDLDLKSKSAAGGWKITTGAGATAVVVGRF